MTKTTKSRIARLQSGRLERLREEGRASLDAQFGDMSDDELERMSSEGCTAEHNAISAAIIGYLTSSELDTLCAPSVQPRDLPRVTPLMWKHPGGQVPLSAREKRVLLALTPHGG